MRVVITKNLEKEVTKRLSPKEADDCFLFMHSLYENPYKGDLIATIGTVAIKELRHKKFRFYFIQSSKVLKLLSEEDLKNHIIKFIAMSDKSKEQQHIINKLKNYLRSFGFDWF